MPVMLRPHARQGAGWISRSDVSSRDDARNRGTETRDRRSLPTTYRHRRILPSSLRAANAGLGPAWTDRAELIQWRRWRAGATDRPRPSPAKLLRVSSAMRVL